jgi:hypothetical protein
MPIDIDSALGADLPEVLSSWTADDALVGLGPGAGVPPTEPRELACICRRGLRVLPSYRVIAALSNAAINTSWSQT